MFIFEPMARLRGCIGAAALVGLLAAVGSPEVRGAEAERLLTPEELVRLESENAMWRAIDVRQSLRHNLAHLRSAGYRDAAVIEALTKIWATSGDWDRGWVSAEGMAVLRRLEMEYGRSLRASLVYQVSGVQDRGQIPPAPDEVWREWIAAISRELSDRDYREFKLANSAGARAVRYLIQDHPTTASERRTLYVAHRDLISESMPPVVRRPAGVPEAPDARQRRISRWEEAESVLGRDRFISYLARSDEAHAKFLNAVLHRGAAPDEAMRIWWAHVRLEAILADTSTNDLRRRDGVSDALKLVRSAIGPEQFEQYALSAEGKWLFARQ